MPHKFFHKSPPSPLKVKIELTNRCNLRCDYCSYFTSEGESAEELSTKEWLDFFDILDREKVLSVNLGGGEPFIRSDLPKLIMGLKQRRLRFSILSNGTLFRDSWIRLIAGTGRCDWIQVSMDGHEADVHDSHRGKGNFGKTVQGIKMLKKYRLPVRIRCTIHKGNFNHLESIARFLLEDLRLSGFSTNEASYAGLCKKNRESLCLDIDEHMIAMDQLTRLAIQYPNRITAAAGPLANARMWAYFEQKKKLGKLKESNCNTLTGCNCMKKEISVRADGTVVPCSLLNLPIGHVKTNDLTELFNDHPEMKRLRARNRIPLTRFPECRDCEYNSVCTGGCAALSLNLLGTDEHPNPDSCYRRFLNLGGKLPESAFQLLDCA